MAASRSHAELQADSLLREIEDLRKDVSGKIQENWNALILPQEGDLNQPTMDHYQQTRPKKMTPEIRKDAEHAFQKWQQKRQAPPPIDDYLRKDTAPATPQSKAPVHQDPGKTHVIPGNGPGQPSATLQQAETLLKRVQASRTCLEYNLDVIQRSKREQEFHTAMNAVYADKDEAERQELRQVVDQYIALVDSQVQEEMAHYKVPGPKAPHSPPTKLLPDKGEQRAARQDERGKPIKGTKKKPVMARIDTGLRKLKDPIGDQQGHGAARERPPREQREKDKRMPVQHITSLKPPDDYKDVHYSSRAYGRTVPYQSHRSTLRDAPYLRIANQSPAIKRSQTSPRKDANRHTAHTQTPAGIIEPALPPPVPVQRRQSPPPSQQIDFYQRHLAVVHPARDTAIPLGAPRLGGERTEPVVIYNQLESTPQPASQRQSNVAVVNIVCQKPQLEIKRLPPVDIYTEVSSISEDRPPLTPQVSPPQEWPVLPDEQYQLSKAQVTDSDEDDTPESSGVLSFHGQPVDIQEYNGPPFPPEPPPPTQPQMRSDDIAVHLQRRELLEHRAVEWVEQELLARMISEFHSRLPHPEVRAPSPLSSESDNTVDALGSGGLQLFVDAGQPVNPNLVASLVREVLEEDIAKMLGQHQLDISREGAQQLHHLEQSSHQDQEESLQQRLSTPEATPPPSPVGSPPPVKHDGKLHTPEPSYSEISEEVEQEPEQETEPFIQAPSSPVGTPPMTPPPASDHVDTPPASNLENPPSVHGDARMLVTPSLTVDETPPCSLIAAEEPEQLSPVCSPLVEKTTPPPSPPPSSPPERELTPPPSSESSTSSTSPEITATETSGQEISAGEWLISQQSQGQVPRAVIQGDLLGLLPVQGGAEESQVTSSDTLLGTVELEADTVQEPAEEGEICKDPNWQPMGDPMVAILTKLNQLPTDYQLSTGYRLPPSRPRGLYQRDQSSPGEISEGQRPILAPDVVNLLEGQVAQRDSGNIPQSPGEVNPVADSVPGVRKPGAASDQTAVGEVTRKDATMRMSDLNSRSSSESKERGEQPQREPRMDGLIEVQARRQSSEDEETTTEGEAHERSNKLAPGIDVVPPPRLIQVDARQSPTDLQPDYGTTGEMVYGPLKSQPMSDGGPPSGTVTPDAMNMEDLLQSGYLTRTFSQSDGFQAPAAPPRGASGGNGSTLQQTGIMGTTYGTTMTEDSLEVGRWNQPTAVTEGTSRPKAVSITIPTTMDEDGSESMDDVGHETISDVSEISAGDL